GGLGLAGEQTGAFEHAIDAKFAPGEFGRIALGKHADAIAVDDHMLTVDADRPREFAVGGVVAGEVRVGFGIAQVVDGDDLDLLGALRLVQGAQDVTADAAVAVDTYFDGHFRFLIQVLGTN